jgi:putative membrane protein
MKFATKGGHTDYSLLIVLGAYSLFWLALAIHPYDRGDWFLENLLVLVAAIVLGSTYRRFQFSKTSYMLILVFLAIHTIGAHYTYAKVPAGFWLQDWLRLQRNHYDRAIHFSFGLLLVYPMRDLLMRSAGAHKRWATWLSVVALAALSSLFEVVEAVVAQIVRPELGTAYLGTQGDMWDAQKDMASAFIGALCAAVWLSLRHPRSRTAQSAGERM